MIYKEKDIDYDEIWKKFVSENKLQDTKDWTVPHFFVSEPGYFSAYFLGSCLAKDLFEYTRNDGLVSSCDYILKEVCSPGGSMDYDEVSRRIKFS